MSSPDIECDVSLDDINAAPLALAARRERVDGSKDVDVFGSFWVRFY